MAAAAPDSFLTQGRDSESPMSNPAAVSAHFMFPSLMAPRTKPRGVIFSRPLSKTAIDKEMNVKGELLQRWSGGQRPESSSFWVQIKYKKKVYPMTCRSRHQRKKHKKWVLSNGWLKLVRKNGLKKGHEVTLFEPHEDKGDFLMVDGLVSSGLIGPDLISAAESLMLLSSVPPPTIGEVIDNGLVSTAETLLTLNSAPPVAPNRALMIDLNSTPATETLNLNATPTTSG